MTDAAPSDEDRRRVVVHRGVRWSYATDQLAIRLGNLDVELLELHGRRAYGTREAARLFHEHAIAVHLMLVAADHLLKAVDLLQRFGREYEPVEPVLRSRIGLLRDYSERWDDHGVLSPPEPRPRSAGRAGRLLAERFPDDDPDGYKWTDGVLGNAGGVLVMEVQALAQFWQPSSLRLRRQTSCGRAGPASISDARKRKRRTQLHRGTSRHRRLTPHVCSGEVTR